MNTLPPQVSELLANAAPSFPLIRSAFRPHPQAHQIAAEDPNSLFATTTPHPAAALAGLLLRLECWDESHQIAQEVQSVEGSYWHGIIHRIEPDSFNAGYWFRRVGTHPIFPPLHDRASRLLAQAALPDWRMKAQWDPFVFIEWCSQAPQMGSNYEAAALDIQLAEWQLLFDWCAGSGT